jgi:hypothetical protein
MGNERLPNGARPGNWTKARSHASKTAAGVAHLQLALSMWFEMLTRTDGLDKRLCILGQLRPIQSNAKSGSVARPTWCRYSRAFSAVLCARSAANGLNAGSRS